MFRRRAIQAHPTITEGGYIMSADKGDAEVFRILMSKGISSDGVGITKEDAAKVTSIGSWFNKNDIIRNFDELKYFTSVTRLEQYAFDGCTSLESIGTENIQSFGRYVFNGCSALQNADISNATEILSYAFQGCSSLVYDDLALLNLLTLAQYGLGSIKARKIRVPNMVTFTAGSINQSSWGNRDYVEEIQVPLSWTAIPAASFYKLSALKKVLGLENVQVINDRAFGYDSQLVELDANLTNITKIGTEGLRLTKSLPSNLSMPLLTSLSSLAFRETNAEKVLDLGTIAAIPDYCFYGCEKLTEIVIPATCSAISTQAFVNCRALQKVVCEAVSPPTLHYQAFNSTNSTFGIYVPDESVDAYKAAGIWSGYATRIYPMSQLA